MTTARGATPASASSSHSSNSTVSNEKVSAQSLLELLRNREDWVALTKTISSYQYAQDDDVVALLVGLHDAMRSF